MANYHQGAESITQAEHISPLKTGDNIEAKRVGLYGYSHSHGEWHRVSANPSGALTVEAVPTKATDEYGIVAISQDATYKYFWFEKDNLDYYVMRKHIANKVFTYTAGAGGYASVYQNPTSGPSGSPTWGSYGATF